MKWIFTEDQKKAGLNRLEIPDEELALEAETLEGDGREYTLTGTATIEGERYHDFQVSFALLEIPAVLDPAHILDADWDWYDFPF